MDNNIQISIIIVSYNNFDILKSCLNSIYKYTTDVIFEVIVIDNASTEGDVDKVTSNYKNLVLIKNKENKGFAAANNQGAKIAKGEYLLLLNNDTVFIDNVVKEIFHFTKSLKTKSIIGCKLLNGDKTLQHSISDFDNFWNVLGEKLFLYLIFKKSKIFNRYNKNYKITDRFMEVDVLKGAFLFISQNDFDNLDGFDEKFFFYSEETDLCKRFKDAGGSIIYYPKSSIIHLGGESTSKNLWFQYKNLNISKIYYFQKHLKGLELYLTIFIHYLGNIIRIPLYLIMGLIKFKSYYFKKAVVYFRSLFIPFFS